MHPGISFFAAERGGPAAGRPAEILPPRLHGRRAWAASIFGLGLLLFTWPFVRTPPLAIAGAYLHLLGAWVAVIAALYALSRALGRADAGRGQGDA